MDREESYVVFATEDKKSMFIEYLIEGIFPYKHKERYKLKKLVTYYFLDEGIPFKGYDGDPLRCLGPE